MSEPIPIFFINLDRSRERRSFMEQQLSDLHLHATRKVAVDGNQSHSFQRDRYSAIKAISSSGRELHPNEIACTLSHIEIYQELVAKQIPSALVLEDDVLLSTTLIETIKNIQNLPCDWELINFANDQAKETPISTISIGKNIHPTNFDGWENRTGAYLIRLSAAEKLLKMGLPVHMAIDDLQAQARRDGLSVYGISPKAVSLLDERFGSDIWCKTDWSDYWQQARTTPLALLVRAFNRIIRSFSRN